MIIKSATMTLDTLYSLYISFIIIMKLNETQIIKTEMITRVTLIEAVQTFINHKSD